MNAIVIACPKCQAKYKLPENARGKVVLCKSCNTRFKVGGAQPAAAVPAAVRPAAQPTAELAQLGVDGPIRQTPDLFETAPPPPHDPLANHVIQDPGFAPLAPPSGDGMEAGESTGAGEYEDLLNNPAVAKPKVVEKKEDPLAQYLRQEDWDLINPGGQSSGQSSSQLSKFVWLIILILFGAGVGLDYYLLGSNPKLAASLSVFLVFAFMMVSLATTIWGLVWIFQNTKDIGLTLLSAAVGPVMFYFMIVHWKSKEYPMSRVFLTTVAIAIAGSAFWLLLTMTNLPAVIQATYGTGQR